jgi:hypothetical protein
MPALAPVAVVAPPPEPPPVAPAPAPAPEPTPAPPSPPVPEPAPPLPAAVEEARPAKPAPVPAAAPEAMGWVEVKATPYAEVTIDGRKQKDAVEGKKRFPLKPGTHTVVLSHPRRTEPHTVVISPNKTTILIFRPLDPL